MPRAGTSWVGKMLDASGRVVYINEPLNPRRPPGRAPGVFRARVRHRFEYISPTNEDEYLAAFEDMLALRYHPLAELGVTRSAGDLLRMAKYWSSFVRGRARRKRPLLDDPYVVFSGDWLHPFREEMEAMRGRSDVIDESGLLWRVIYHVVAGYRDRSPLVHIVRHEDLSRDATAEFARLYERLGLRFTDDVERTVERSATGAQDQQAHAWSLSRKGISRTGFRPMDSRANISAWKTQLTADEIERVRALTAETAAAYYGDDDWR